MAPARTAWVATGSTRRRKRVLRIVAVVTALLGAAGIVVLAATGGVDQLRRLLPSDLAGPVIASVERGEQPGTPVAAPASGGGVRPRGAPAREASPEPDPLPEVEGSTGDREATPEPDPARSARDEAPAEGPAPARTEDAEEDAEASLREIQERLQTLGYLVGPADGAAGAQTQAAVMAFQRVNGLQVDAVIGPRTREALAAPVVPEPGGGPATRIAVDLDRQLLHLVEDGERTVTLHVSSGSGQPYTTASGGTAVSITPVGEFTVERRIAGARRADLGTLYDPLYFHRGWAIHGSNSVPAEPASHGCIRITRADARWLFDRVANGIPVHISGGEHVFVPSGD